MFLFITAWALTGLILAGYLYGPYHWKGPQSAECEKMRWAAIFCGLIMGPFTFVPITMFYSEWWATLNKQFHWHHVFDFRKS